MGAAGPRLSTPVMIASTRGTSDRPAPQTIADRATTAAIHVRGTRHEEAMRQSPGVSVELVVSIGAAGSLDADVWPCGCRTASAVALAAVCGESRRGPRPLRRRRRLRIDSASPPEVTAATEVTVVAGSVSVTVIGAVTA